MCSNVLLLAGDTNSRLVNDKDRSLKLVFGDAGTATLITKGNKEMCIVIHSDGSGFDKLIVPAGGFRKPISDSTKDLITDEDGNSRTEENIYMDGMEIFSFAISKVPKNIREVLDLQKWQCEDVTLFALHQANKFIIDCIRKRLKLPKELVPLNLQYVGNTGPASIPLLLSDVGCTSLNKSLKKVILCGFGVGLSWGTATCDLSETHFYKPINK